jgi:hypothetical protein
MTTALPFKVVDDRQLEVAGRTVNDGIKVYPFVKPDGSHAGRGHFHIRLNVDPATQQPKSVDCILDIPTMRITPEMAKLLSTAAQYVTRIATLEILSEPSVPLPKTKKG